MVLPECNLIKPDGIKCGSPALRGGQYCYFHQRHIDFGGPRARVRANVSNRIRVDGRGRRYPMLRSRDPIQQAIQSILNLTVAGQISTQHSGILVASISNAVAHKNKCLAEERRNARQQAQAASKMPPARPAPRPRAGNPPLPSGSPPPADEDSQIFAEFEQLVADVRANHELALQEQRALQK